MTTSLQKVVYTAEATADFGRDGGVTISDSPLTFALAKPPGMGGKAGAEGANPEQLFAAGYAACFHGALLFHARARKIAADGSRVTARVDIGPVAGGGLGLGVELIVQLPGVDETDAASLVETAHDACPYSRATRGNIDVRLTVKT
jgi:lipoyl-dependent peroxiredoxin